MAPTRPDTASGDPNLYRYAGNDPINTVDPDGTDWNYHSCSRWWRNLQETGEEVCE
ncbi:MAG: hypothetical protein ACP5RN_04270 [Armatimonadota bacterium]